MLNYDDPLWAPLKDLFDIKVLLSFDLITENNFFFLHKVCFTGIVISCNFMTF